jgi:hypothetical protein
MPNQKYIPQILGFYLDVVSITDNIDNALAIKEYPFSSVNIVENLGPKTRRIAVVCQFNNRLNVSGGWNIGSAFFPTYDNLDAFISAFREYSFTLTFTHPDYGELKGKLGKISIDRDDTEEFGEVSFDFFEEISTIQRNIVAVQYKTANEFRATNDKTVGKMITALKNAKYAIGWAANANTQIGKLNGFLNDVTNPITSITNTITYAANVPGQYIQSINKAVDRVVNSFIDIRNTPASFVNNIILGVRQLKAIFTGVDAQYVHIMGASRVAYETASVFEDDTKKNNIIEKKAKTKSFDSSGNYVGEGSFEIVMAINELDDTSYNVRKLIDEAIQFDRNNRSLQNGANDIQKYVDEIKLDRQRVETIDNVPLQSMHTWSTINNLSYQVAETILKLNPTVKNPTFIDGELKLLV